MSSGEKMGIGQPRINKGTKPISRVHDDLEDHGLDGPVSMQIRVVPIELISPGRGRGRGRS